MSVTSEVPASFRSSAMQPGAVGLIRDGIAETLSRRRLIRYLVRADVKKKGADTLLGNIWWVVDPLLQMLVYVILVSVIFTRPQPDYPLFVFAADPALEVVHLGRGRRRQLRRRRWSG